MTTLNGLPPSWEYFIKLSVDAPSFPNLTNYGKIALGRRRGLQQDKDFMALNLRRIKHSWPMPRKEREREESFTTISIKVEDQSLLQIEGRRRRIYHTYNAISARNMVTMQTSVLVQTRGSMKPQPLC